MRLFETNYVMALEFSLFIILIHFMYIFLGFSPNGKFIMSGDGHGKLHFWDWKTTKVNYTILLYTASIYYINIYKYYMYYDTVNYISGTGKPLKYTIHIIYNIYMHMHTTSLYYLFIQFL